LLGKTEKYSYVLVVDCLQFLGSDLLLPPAEALRVRVAVDGAVCVGEGVLMAAGRGRGGAMVMLTLASR
jgi:hypothetical protein